MSKSRVVLGSAIALSLLGSPDARAVDLGADGLGQVLLFPYYTVNQGNNTLISLINTSHHAKAVKVRFREGRNGRDVLEFNVYLSPFDVWTAALFASDQDGPPRLLTRDESCTVPPIKHNEMLPQTAGGDRYVPFRNVAYVGTHNDRGGTGLDRTREGFLEMIEMGELSDGPGPTQLAEEATHVDGIPLSCGAIQAAWVDGGWAQNSGADIGLPAGGLRGTASIVDVANGTLHTYVAEAIENFYTNSADPGRLHTIPGSAKPDLADADNGGGIARSYVFAGGAPLESDWPVGTANAVSALFMHDAIMNEFVTEPTLGASSEWIVTFPTKSFYTDNGNATAPFTNTFTDDGRACELVSINPYNREEIPALPPGSGIQFPEQPPDAPDGKFRFCVVAQVLTFNQEAAVTAGASKIFGSRYAFNLNAQLDLSGLTAESGLARVTFDDPDAQGLQNELASFTTGYVGLPVIGFWSANYVNAAAQPGKLANYSGAIRHGGTRRVEVDF